MDILEFVPDASHAVANTKTIPREARARQLMLRSRRERTHLRKRKQRWKTLRIASHCRCNDQCKGTHSERSAALCASCDAGAPKILLRAGLQLVDRLAILQHEIKCLGFMLFDTAARKSSSVRLEALLPIVRRLADSSGILHRDRMDPTISTLSEPNRSTAEEIKSDASPLLVVQAFDWLRGTSAIVQGDVICAEWISLWRNQRNEYACLCDDGVLYFFCDKRQCHDFLVERTRAQVSTGLSPSTRKKTRKERLPLRQIDLLESEWTVRICESDAGNNASERHAFAFFDQQNQSRLIVDVASRAQLIAWTSAILNELKQNEFYMQMRRRRLDAVSSDQQRDLGPRFSDLVAGIPDKQFEVPLRWLHARMDRLDSTARQERSKSTTFNQALKDLTRDRIRINGVLFDGSGVEQILSALLMHLLQVNAPSPGLRYRLESRNSIDYNDSSESVADEMAALRVAQHLLICCSRTHGGGDILDTLHLMLQSNRFCICAESRDTEPIQVQIVPGEQHDATGEMRVAPMAVIKIALVYRVACLDEDDKLLRLPGEDDVEPSSTDSDSDDAAFSGDQPPATTRAEPHSAPRIRGVYTQKLICIGNEWQELHGSVHVSITA